MKQMQLLLVEDNDLPIERVRTSLDAWNERNEEAKGRIELIVARTEKEANYNLNKYRIDCAMVDIRIPQDTGKENAKYGNQLINTVLSERGIPIAVMSGNMADLAKEIVEQKHITRFEKGDAGIFDKAIEWFGDHWVMMQLLRKSRHEVEKSSAEIFSRRLWPNWSEIPSALSEEEVVGIITRQYAAHLVELLGLESPDSVPWHPFEAYVNPSMNENRAHTGDVFYLDDQYWVVLSPQCDMATQKIRTVALANCSTKNEEWDDALNHLTNKDASKSKCDKAKKLLGKYVNQNVAPNSHFLPPMAGSTNALMVDFGHLYTIPIEDLNDQLEHRVVSVSTPFLANLTQRFGAYISRAGQPNIKAAYFTTGGGGAAEVSANKEATS